MGVLVALDFEASCRSTFQTMDPETGCVSQLALGGWKVFRCIITGRVAAVFISIPWRFCRGPILQYDFPLAAILPDEERCFLRYGTFLQDAEIDFM